MPAARISAHTVPYGRGSETLIPSRDRKEAVVEVFSKPGVGNA
jgi:hypothetical protein